MSEEERKAIEEITIEITDEYSKEYMNKWFLDDLTILIKLIEKQQKEIEKKDKIIDLMANELRHYDLDERICKNIDYCIADNENRECEDCLIEYFKKKARENNA